MVMNVLSKIHKHGLTRLQLQVTKFSVGDQEHMHPTISPVTHMQSKFQVPIWTLPHGARSCSPSTVLLSFIH